ALARLDLEDDVAPVVGVARHEHAAQALARLLLGGAQRRQLRGERVAVLAPERRELRGGLGVAARLAPRAVGADDLVELGVAPPERARAARVGVDGGVGELGLDVGVLGEQRLDGGERLGHGRLLGRCGGSVRRRVRRRGPAAVRRHRPRTTRQRRWSERTDCPWRGCRARTTGAAVSLLAGGLLAVAGLEAGHTATGVEDLLLARVERVAGA